MEDPNKKGVLQDIFPLQYSIKSGISELMPRLGHGQQVQAVFQLFFRQQIGFHNQLTDRDSGLQGLLGDIGGLFVTKVWAEGGGQGDAGFYQLFASLPVGCNAEDTVID